MSSRNDAEEQQQSPPLTPEQEWGQRPSDADASALAKQLAASAVGEKPAAHEDQEASALAQALAVDAAQPKPEQEAAEAAHALVARALVDKPEAAAAPAAEAPAAPSAPVALAEPEEPLDPNRKWYVIHTYSGYENKVAANLQRRIESMGMKHKIFRLMVPTEEEIEFRDGKKRTVQKKIYPGYVLVEMIMEDDSWYVVRNTAGVTGFVGPGVKPVALPPEEVKKILQQMGEGEPIKVKIDLVKGQGVRVIHGPFQDFTGLVEEINVEKEKLKVLITMFGRETPVEVDFGQVEKL